MVADEHICPSGTGDLVFAQGRPGNLLICKPKSSENVVLYSDDFNDTKSRVVGSRRRETSAAPFASVTMSAAPALAPPGTCQTMFSESNFVPVIDCDFA